MNNNCSNCGLTLCYAKQSIKYLDNQIRPDCYGNKGKMKCYGWRPEGYIQIKEYQMWGKCNTFKNYDTGDVLYTSYSDITQQDLVDWDTLKEQLKKLWRPVAQEELNFFFNEMVIT